MSYSNTITNPNEILLQQIKNGNPFVTQNLKQLIKSGVVLDPNYKEEDTGCTLLIWASAKSNNFIVNMLLNIGADPNIKDNIGNSPIIIAIRRNNINLIKLLLSKGANIPENINELLENKSEQIKLIFRNWPTIMGLAVTEPYKIDEGSNMNFSEFLGTRRSDKNTSGGRKRRKQKSKKNKRKSKKNKRKSIKRRK
jgi:ankyrin repeat protein